MKIRKTQNPTEVTSPSALEREESFDAPQKERPIRRHPWWKQLLRAVLMYPFMLVQRPRWKKVGIFILIIVGWIGAFYFYNQYQTLVNDPNVASQRETARLVSELGELIELPQDELPSIATITDVSALATNEPFFEKAQNGDTLLIYQQAQTAYLYRLSEKKIINVGTLVLPPASDQAFEASPTQVVDEETYDEDEDLSKNE